MENLRKFSDVECKLVARSWKKDLGHPSPIGEIQSLVFEKYSAGFLEAIIQQNKLYFWFDFSIHKQEKFEEYLDKKIFDILQIPESPDIVLFDNVFSALPPLKTFRLMRLVIKRILKKYPTISQAKRFCQKRNHRETTINIKLIRKEL